MTLITGRRTAMNRKTAPLIAFLLTAVILAGCGKKSEDPEAIHYGLVTDSAGITNGAVSELSAGMELAAQAKACRTQIYPAASNSEDALREAFDAAAGDNVKYVLCQGEVMEKPLGKAQAAHKKSKYILFDGIPVNSSGKTAEIRNNTMCVIFDKPSMGFLVGYAVVKEGLRTVGYMTGTVDDEDGIAYQTGFLNGIGYAQQVMGLEAGSVKILREYAGTENLSPLRKMDADALYDAGAEMIVTDIEAFIPAIEIAASSHSRHAAAIGFDPGSGTVVLAATENHEGVAEWILNKVEADSKAFMGGDILNAGVAENGVRLRVDYSALTTFTDTDMQHVLEAMAGGNAGVTAGGAESGDSNENASAGGLTSAGAAVSIQDLAPVTPDPNAGLGAGTPAAAQTASEAEAAEEGTDA